MIIIDHQYIIPTQTWFPLTNIVGRYTLDVLNNNASPKIKKFSKKLYKYKNPSKLV